MKHCSMRNCSEQIFMRHGYRLDHSAGCQRKKEDGTIRAQMMMLAGFCLLLFFSMGIYTLFHFPPELSAMYAVILNAEVMQVCAAAASIRVGCGVFGALSAAGLVLFLVKGKNRRSFFSPGIIFWFLLFAGALVLFHGGFIQQYDDFHQWALEVKYMLEHNALPRAGGLVPIVPMESGLFNVFFQVLGGYNEGNMHASAFLFTAAALVLPLAGIPWRRWKGAVCYLLLTYLGMFSIYKLPYKSLYVDLPAAAWAGVLCAWWITGSEAFTGEREGAGNLIRRLVTVLPILLFVTRIKWGIGLLLAVFTGMFIAVSILTGQKGEGFRALWKRRWKQIVGVFAVIVLAFGILWGLLGSSFVPASLSGIAEALTFSTQKARLTMETLLQNLFMKHLTTNPNMRLYPVQSVIVLTVLLVFTAYLGRSVYRKKICLFAAYYPVCVVLYVAALYVTYVSTFSYEESIRNATGYRYLSVIVLYGFFVLTAMMLHAFVPEVRPAGQPQEGRPEGLPAGQLQEVRLAGSPDGQPIEGASGEAPAGLASPGNRAGSIPEKMAVRRRLQVVMLVGLMAFFLSNLNSKFLYLASEIQEWKLPQYKVIRQTKQSIDRIEDIIAENDKVYLLSNGYDLENMNEYPLCVALYYLGERVSNYLVTPWQFHEGGSLSFVANTDLTVDAFPDLLRGGGYTYVWIHSYDPYLARSFRRLFNCSNLREGLYRIQYQEDGAIRLEYVSDLKPVSSEKGKTKSAGEQSTNAAA